MEDGLQVTIDLRSDAIEITGPNEVWAGGTNLCRLRESAQVGCNTAERRTEGDVKLVIADPATTLKSLVDSGKAAVGLG